MDDDGVTRIGLDLDQILDEIGAMTEIKELRRDGEFTRQEFADRHKLSPSTAIRKLEDLVRTGQIAKRLGPRCWFYKMIGGNDEKKA